jgi:hypothetical protein
MQELREEIVIRVSNENLRAHIIDRNIEKK